MVRYISGKREMGKGRLMGIAYGFCYVVVVCVNIKISVFIYCFLFRKCRLQKNCQPGELYVW